MQSRFASPRCRMRSRLCSKHKKTLQQTFDGGHKACTASPCRRASGRELLDELGTGVAETPYGKDWGHSAAHAGVQSCGIVPTV